MPRAAPISSQPIVVSQTKKQVPYILGHSEHEIRRLMLQSAILKPITTRLLRDAGVMQGMRVLDLGCGTGDVSMLAADLVGPSGAVIGIDRSGDVLRVARERARIGGYRNIEFVQGDAESYDDPAPFDAAIGRYILIHQADPAVFIRSIASRVRRGGIVAFHEIGLYGDCPIVPRIELWDKCWNWVVDTFASVMTYPDAGGRMTSLFEDAGLEQTKVSCEMPVDAGPESPFYAWMALSVRSIQPQIEALGLATSAEVNIDTLEERLRQSTLAQRAQMQGFQQFCGWATC